jgi:hypothetical protein
MEVLGSARASKPAVQGAGGFPGAERSGAALDGQSQSRVPIAYH